MIYVFAFVMPAAAIVIAILVAVMLGKYVVEIQRDIRGRR